MLGRQGMSSESRDDECRLIALKMLKETTIYNSTYVSLHIHFSILGFRTYTPLPLASGKKNAENIPPQKMRNVLKRMENKYVFFYLLLKPGKRFFDKIISFAPISLKLGSAYVSEDSKKYLASFLIC